CHTCGLIARIDGQRGQNPQDLGAQIKYPPREAVEHGAGGSSSGRGQYSSGERRQRGLEGLGNSLGPTGAFNYANRARGSIMNEPISAGISIDWAKLVGFWQGVLGALEPYVLNPVRLGELGAILLAFLLSFFLAPRIQQVMLGQARRAHMPKPGRELLVSLA